MSKSIFQLHARVGELEAQVSRLIDFVEQIAEAGRLTARGGLIVIKILRDNGLGLDSTNRKSMDE